MRSGPPELRGLPVNSAPAKNNTKYGGGGQRFTSPLTVLLGRAFHEYSFGSLRFSFSPSKRRSPEKAETDFGFILRHRCSA